MHCAICYNLYVCGGIRDKKKQPIRIVCLYLATQHIITTNNAIMNYNEKDAIESAMSKR